MGGVGERDHFNTCQAEHVPAILICHLRVLLTLKEDDPKGKGLCGVGKLGLQAGNPNRLHFLYFAV